VVQGRGIVGRIRGDVLREHLKRDAAARELFLRYVYAFTASTSQTAACNRLHVVTQRLAHWLLLLHDRVGSDELALTQEFLALMLGTRRAGVNAAVAELKGIRAINHRRNHVMVTDRQRLEEASCPCYAMKLRDYERALGFRPIAPVRSSIV
jgi:CRP-like cAMP-binding protein